MPGMLVAALALAAVVPWWAQRQHTATPSTSQTASGARAPIVPSRIVDMPAPIPQQVATAADDATVKPERDAGIRVRGTHAIRDAAPRGRAASAGLARGRPPSSSQTARASAAHRSAPPDLATAAAAAGEPTVAVLTGLYAESARLEALLAVTRDDRVQSATAALLADDLDARVGLIDAALAEPGIAASKRTALWQQRVAALREMAGTESSERWLAANGAATGDALVRID